MPRQRNQPEPETTDAARDAERVYNLTLDLKRAKREKKEAVRMHNEEIRRVQAEIDEIINREPSQADEDSGAEPPPASPDNT
ncbi:hypothetical protein EKK58_00185 [Candidatus Dependentiae bacterium]|nr:MAG: hypothetical protein EKK58_00185 [Candidatus Dependentiae bacterium]